MDPRAKSLEKLIPPEPLPVLSRRCLRRVRHPMPPPARCNCCNGDRVDLVENSEIYRGRSYGEWPYAYLCRSCGAYVGLHPGTDLPLGTLADAALREVRNRCKKPFERIWREGHMKRTDAYAWLADQLGLEGREAHFGLFDAERCELASAVCLRYLEGR